MARKPDLNFTFALSITATRSAMAMPTGTVRIQNQIVFHVAFQNSGVENMVT